MDNKETRKKYKASLTELIWDTRERSNEDLINSSSEEPLDWDALSMRQKAAFIRSGVANGYRNIDSIKDFYNTFKSGGKKDTNTSRKQHFLEQLEESLLNNSRYSTPEWRRLLVELALLESNFQEGALNPIGAKGYFQLMPFNRSKTWNTQTQQFDEMYKLMDNNIATLSKRLTDSDKKRAAELGIDLYGIMAGAHLGGVDNALKALRGLGNAKDMNNSSVLGYMRRFSLGSDQYNAPSQEQEEEFLYTLPSLYIEVPNYYRQLLKRATESDPEIILPEEPEAVETLILKPTYISYSPQLVLALMNALTSTGLPLKFSTPLTATEILKLQALQEEAAQNNSLLDIENIYDSEDDYNLFRGGGEKSPVGGTLITVRPGEKVSSDQCAAWSNGLLRDNGYLVNGNAWTLGNVDMLFNGFEGLERPVTYDEALVRNYNHQAADNVYKNFDSKTLDKSRPYVVNMFYNNSPALEDAYNKGKGVTGTHTGVLTYDEPTGKWWVTHNIHGNIHQDPFIGLLSGKGKYGVTAIYSPRRDTLWNRAKGFLGFANGGYVNVNINNYGFYN